MTNGCSRETETLAALRSDTISEELDRHLQSCEICGDLLLVEAALAVQARQSGQSEPPPAGAVWWRLERRLCAADLDRALRPIRWARRVAAAAMTSALLLAGASYGRGWVARLGDLDPQAATRWLSAESSVLAVSVLLVAVLVLVTAERWATDA